jgi:hypothetical protein
MAKKLCIKSALLPIGAAIFMIVSTPLIAENVTKTPSCYPGLPCPGAEQPPGDSDGQGASSGLDQQPSDRSDAKYFYVGPVAPPDPWLALRTEPSSTRGERIMKMPQGTLLRQLERRGFWWRVELTTGQQGWAHSKWIKCCKSVNE